MPPLSFTQAKQAVAACIQAEIAVILVGPPGIGKTALLRAASADAGRPCHELLGSNIDATDIAGLPFVVDGQLRRALLAQVQACVAAPGVLFLDELTTVPPSVQGPLMRLLLERQAGDVKLHPGSVVVGAANRPEECPGGIELSAATVNRVVKLEYQPTLAELQAFFDTVGDEGSRLRDECLDFAATLGVSPDLLDMTPPRAAIDAAAPFGSPRAWERGLRAYAAYCEATGVGSGLRGGEDDDVAYAILAGAVGEAKAIAFLAIRKQRKFLPAVDEVIADPATAKLPEQKDRQLAATGLLARVADRDSWAAWIYADRLLPEIGAACARMLATRTAKGSAKHAKAGAAAQLKLLAKTRRAM
jgi:hypothetical protein